MNSQPLVTLKNTHLSEAECLELGDEYFAKKEFDAAIAAYSKAITLNHSSYMAYFKRSKVHYCLKNFIEAELDCQRAILGNWELLKLQELQEWLNTLLPVEHKAIYSTFSFLNIFQSILTGDKYHPFIVSAKKILFYEPLSAEEILQSDNFQYSPNWTLLHVATLSGNCEAIEQLAIAHSVNINSTNSSDCTLLHIAADSGHTAAVESLLKHGAEVNKADINGFAPLHIAAENGHTAVVECLLNHGAEINKADTSRVAPPLYLAAQNGHLTVVECLLNHGADVNKANTNGFTSLHIAAENGHTAIVECLLNHGAEINKADTSRVAPPLYLAAQNGHLTVVECLLNYGAKVNKANTNGAAPLHIAAENGHTAIVECLLEYGAEVNKANTNGAAPLHFAALNGHIAVVECLAKHGADVNKANTNGFTPLHAAAKQGHADIVKCLINKNAKVNQASNNGRISLIKRIFSAFSQQASNNDGITPLYLAAQNNHTAVAEYLIKHGADVYKADTNGFTPLHAAVERGHTDVVKLLITHSALLEIKVPKTIPLFKIKSTEKVTASDLAPSEEFRQFLEICHQQRFLGANMLIISKTTTIYCNFFNPHKKLPQPDCQIICADAPTHKR